MEEEGEARGKESEVATLRLGNTRQLVVAMRKETKSIHRLK